MPEYSLTLALPLPLPLPLTLTLALTLVSQIAQLTSEAAGRDHPSVGLG